ncbi:hypothetical protein UA75_06885 [Actinoalloteichus sp. GBA129-24]|uniref:Uncharacterized protein n=1 Tax=Actinoalloteichus fjordicus TaxID=1612552 RepID=A0AAC9PQU8_9PSEU|nr:hypothetical protein UA74_06890 [Actinoalloteichus fjordicus]APU19397.1 hypothetical protein UA75_06885 [Actinoalloteichus sp. GBA129-24]
MTGQVGVRHEVLIGSPPICIDALPSIVSDPDRPGPAPSAGTDDPASGSVPDGRVVRTGRRGGGPEKKSRTTMGHRSRYRRGRLRTIGPSH